MAENAFSDVPVAVVTGGSAGLGFEIALHFAKNGYHLVLVGRNEERLKTAHAKIKLASHHPVQYYICDVTIQSEVQQLFKHIESDCNRLDVLLNCVGKSDRGLLQDLSAESLSSLIDANLLSALYCTQQSLQLLEQSHGVIVNIGSLASKVGARFIGGYSIAKHGLAGMTQQFRLELKERGIHVCLLSPGPIRRTDEGQRYEDRMSENLPEQARRPGGGTRVKGLSSSVVAAVALEMVRKRQPDRVLPGYLRLLIGVGHLWPRLGDWLLLKFTSSHS